MRRMCSQHRKENPMDIKCESCHRQIDRLMFKITFENGTWFNVCEECAPVPDKTKYQLEVVDLVRERERYEETRS